MNINNVVARQKWIDHKFMFGNDVGWTHNILSRLRDTKLRIKHYCEGYDEKFLENQLNNKWSVKQHIGHLIDLEALHFERLEQFKRFVEVLTPADMSNSQTEKAMYNDIPLSDLIEEFEQKRRNFLKAYENLSKEHHHHDAFHNRLGVNMKPVDLLFFMAEHDDHHLTSIFEITASYNKL